MFQPFRQGIEIYTLYDATRYTSSSAGIKKESDSAIVALLRYETGAQVPRHRHPGTETIMVLEGSQSDASGCYKSGSLIINPVGSEHSVWSEHGCVVLIQWNKPVEFI